MINVLIDTQALACPDINEDYDRAQSFATHLLSIRQIAKETSIRLLISSALWEVLEKEGSTPPWGPSSEWQSLQLGDISKVFISLVNRMRYIEEVTGIRDILIANVACDPPETLSDRTHAFRKDYCRVRFLWGVWEEYLAPREADVPLIASDFVQPTVVRAEGDVIDIDVEDGEDSLDERPFHLSNEILHVGSAESLIRAVSPTDAWELGFKDLAIKLALAQRGELRISGWFNVKTPNSWRFHEEFQDSADSYNFITDQGRSTRLIRTLVDTILNERMNQTRHIRVSPSGGAPPVTRAEDGAVAWRRDIDHEFRVHYWRQGVEIEFAVVAAHDDVHIPI